jgi:hypothetical protein
VSAGRPFKQTNVRSVVDASLLSLFGGPRTSSEEISPSREGGRKVYRRPLVPSVSPHRYLMLQRQACRRAHVLGFDGKPSASRKALKAAF